MKGETRGFTHARRNLCFFVLVSTCNDALSLCMISTLYIYYCNMEECNNKNFIAYPLRFFFSLRKSKYYTKSMEHKCDGVDIKCDKILIS